MNIKKNPEIEEKVEKIANTLMLDYQENKKIDQLLPYDHPDKDDVAALLSRLQIIVYPGYYKNKVYHAYTRKTNVQMLLEDVVYNLIRQIKIVLPYLDTYKQYDEEGIERVATNKTFAFLENLPRIRHYTETDVEAAYEGDPAAFNEDEIIFSYPGLKATLVNRIAHELYLLDIPILPRMMTEQAHAATGIDIHPGATIGEYFFIDHATGVVIGETTIIGNHVKIYQGVTLGALSTKGGQALKNVKRHPTIGNNVTIYSGASVLGGDTVIGDGAVIGGNVFITTSIPAGARVSVKNQELRYSYGKDHTSENEDDNKKQVHSEELPPDDSWFYMI